jgi:hypothetical protein
MLTCKSPRKVMIVAHALARSAIRAYRSKFSRRDFTQPQIFACLVVREQMDLSYRDTEVLLQDGRSWCRAIGMKKIPDHNTLCRGFHTILNDRRIERMLDLLAEWFKLAKALGWCLAIDSTLLETHHRSRHYEQRCRHHASKRSGNARRSASAKRTPKLALGVDVRSHLILSAKAKTGMGSDAPDFDPILFHAWRRGKVKVVLADAGYDSEANHRIARLDMKVRSLIKTGVGRQSSKPPAGHYRRMMRQQLQGSQKGKLYGKRAQAETVMSMIKRNLGDALRARSPRARRIEQRLLAITHDVMLPRRQNRWSRQSRTDPKNGDGV